MAEQNRSMLGWTRGQWGQFMWVFGLVFVAINALFWIGLINQEVRIRRAYEKVFLSFDREWEYLQRLTALLRIEAGYASSEERPLVVFRGRHLGISFAYPGIWGEFEESFPKSYYVSAQFKRGYFAHIAGAYSDEPPLEHDRFWDRLAVGVELPDDLEEICADLSRIATTCLKLETASGIRYVRVRYDVYNDPNGYSVRDAVIYVFARPGGDFPGVALSNIELRRAGIPHDIAEMDRLMESVVLES